MARALNARGGQDEAEVFPLRDEHPSNVPVAGNGTQQTGHAPLLKVADIGSVFDFDAGGVEYDVERIIPGPALICLSGESGHGKTSVAHAMAWAMSTGQDFAGFATKSQPILILDRENPLEFTQERSTRLGIVDGPKFQIWGGWQPEQAPDPSVPRIMEWAAAQDPKPLIIADSLISFLEGDENSSTDVRACFQRWRALVNLGCTVIVITHSGKGENTKDYRGSSDIKAAVEVGYSISNIGSDPTVLEFVRMRCRKSRVQVEADLTLRLVGSKFERTGGGSQTKTNHDLANEVLRGNPDLNARELQTLVTARGVSQKIARDIIQAWQDDPRVSVTRGERNARFLRWKGDPDDYLQ